MKINSIFFVLLMTLFTVSACSRTDEQLSAPQEIASDFTLTTVDGEKIVLSDILRTRKAVLKFWATWCPYCREVIPQMEKFYRENKDKVAVIGIDIKESKTKVENFIRKIEISYPIALDTDGSVARLYKVRGVPTIVVVDKDSKIIYYGHSVQEMLEQVDFSK
ncbi:MAG: TlpA family protein disulfide reductase [Omnitrophica bacterium]|nr:TlpA family protein disulfide reductase [Candidatus Omnitrophota bacterium]